MKKTLALILAALLLVSAFAFAGCTKETKQEETKVIRVGASTTPHAEILEAVRGEIEAAGYTLEIVEFTDYVLPNTTLESGELDANYFQHQPYLTDFNENNNTHIVSIGAVHYEPYGIYPGTCTSLDQLTEGAKVAVPNDSTNEARALQLLAAAGLITLNADAGLAATKIDIIDNPLKLDIVEIEAAQLARNLPDVAIAVINGNYAIEAGLSVARDALVIEDASSEAAVTFANILAVREGDESREDLQALYAALTGETARAFILETYDGAVIPSF